VLTGFGTFGVMQRKARTGINPMTKKAMKIPAKRVPRFKAGKALKAMIK
jgi:DNA-binding protein HU-beta